MPDSNDAPLQEPVSIEPETPVLEAGTTPGDGVALTLALDQEAEARRRRRKGLLLLLLASLVAMLLAFSGWYLLFRQPISELPLPGISQPELPHYVYSIYGVNQPIGVAADPSGDRLYVAETGGERLVHIFDAKGNEIDTFKPPNSTAATRTPVYIAIDPLTSDVYVSDRMASAIYVYDRDGNYRRRFEPAVPQATFAPLGLAFDRQGHLYVSDVGGPVHRIIEFDRDAVLVREIGDPGEFSFPNGLAVDDLDRLVVVDSNNGRVGIFDGAGRTVGAIGRGVAAGELGLPRGAAIDPAGRLFVADSTGHAIRVYRLDGDKNRPVFAGAVGSEGLGDGQFEFPNGVATDARARIYVADWANDRVQVWSY